MRFNGFISKRTPLKTVLLILVLSTCAIAGDSTDSEVSSTLVKWSHSLGSVGALEAIDNYYQRFNLATSGLTGTLEVWQRSDGRRRIHIKLGEVFTYTNVFDGTASFSSENGGRFREDAGVDLATVTGFAYVESFAMLLPNRMRAHLPPAIDIKDSVTICTLTPAAGFAMQYFLGRDNLPDSSVIYLDGQRRVTRYSQWKTIAGVLWPHSQFVTNGDSRFDETYDLQVVETNLALSDSLFTRPRERVSRVRFPEETASVQISMDLFGNHIFIPVKVNSFDTTLWFIFDTGATLSVLNKDRLAHLGIETAGAAEGRGVGDAPVEISFASDVSFDIGGTKIEDLTVYAISLDNFTARLGRGIDGIIGNDVISEIIARINYQDSSITMYAKGAFTPSQGAHALQLTFSGNIPFAEASIRNTNGASVIGRFALDTGRGAGFTFHSHFATVNHLIGNGIPSIEAPGSYGAGGQTTAKFIRVPEITIGGTTITNPLVAVELGAASNDSAGFAQGVIGGDVFRYFTLTFDYAGNTLWVERAYDTIRPGEMDMLGAQIILSGNDTQANGFEIIGVLQDSPAQAAGLMVGDIIVEIDGIAAKEFTLPALRSFFKSQDGAKVGLSVISADKTHKTMVTLRRMI